MTPMEDISFTLLTTEAQLEAIIAAGIAAGIANYEAARTVNRDIPESSGGVGGTGQTVGHVTRSNAAVGTGGVRTGSAREIPIPVKTVKTEEKEITGDQSGRRKRKYLGLKTVKTEEKEITEDQSGKRKRKYLQSKKDIKKQGQSSNSNAGQTYAAVTDNRQKSQKCDKCGYYHKLGSCKQAWCERCQKMGHYARRCRGQLVDIRVCYWCDQPGHLMKDCPKRANND